MNFRYLDDLIHSGASEIVLKEDITLDPGEETQYKDGIKLDVEGLVIDGKRHTIDACGKARIFECTDHITLKNITLKNGFTSHDGGAIFNNKGKVILINSKFESNKSENDGGAIENYKGEVSIEKSKFESNKSENDGGAIENYKGKLQINKSKFQSNRAEKYGGSIFGVGSIESEVRKSNFKNDFANFYNSSRNLSICDYDMRIY